MFGSLGTFGRHVPQSDPPIPPKDQCLGCGKKPSSDNPKLLRCSACKMAYFCSKQCQAKAWKGKGTVTKEKHRDYCPKLRPRSEHHLPFQVRVIRSRSGAYIENSEAIPKTRPPRNQEERDELREQDLNECAKDHYFTVVKNLTDEQLQARYPLACIERWGGKAEQHRSEHDVDGESYPGTVALKDILGFDNDVVCEQCGRDGQQFFSFCLNRPVNSDRVQHCEFCHRCFYFRPGCLRGCAHCGMGYYYNENDDPQDLAHAAGITVEEAAKKLSESSGSELVIQYADDSRGCNIPNNADYFTVGLAREGYWGY